MHPKCAAMIDFPMVTSEQGLAYSLHQQPWMGTGPHWEGCNFNFQHGQGVHGLAERQVQMVAM
jgi:hypothetical protein